ncbi:acyl-CoA thioesterase [Cytobacillus spongiae]|uniref:acyl-CoA thioesterase n=1 Tax=Cytobacillus spongiae TaxID=2901381 RepID=UPI001F26E60B|nr:thioesterase family protein [Cytobacillus spongiae]UII55095.1 acyl-CoA thioesterase [Cytobacillus spongiae]
MSRISYIDNLSEWKEGFEFFFPVKVRFSETDMFGHLNNTVPFTYYEEARTEFFKSKGFMQEWVKPDFEAIPVVADLQCDYLKQVFYDERINIHVKVNHIGTSSVDLHYMGRKEDGTICFVGRGTIVQISRVSGKSVPWTEEMKNMLVNKDKVKVKG